MLGFRVDGRRPQEIRKLNCRMGVFQQADGSAFLELGNTKILASVYGPHSVSIIVPDLCVLLFKECQIFSDFVILN